MSMQLTPKPGRMVRRARWMLVALLLLGLVAGLTVGFTAATASSDFTCRDQFDRVDRVADIVGTELGDRYNLYELDVRKQINLAGDDGVLVYHTRGGPDLLVLNGAGGQAFDPIDGLLKQKPRVVICMGAGNDTTQAVPADFPGVNGQRAVGPVSIKGQGGDDGIGGSEGNDILNGGTKSELRGDSAFGGGGYDTCKNFEFGNGTCTNATIDLVDPD
jgi:hypothetical protein